MKKGNVSCHNGIKTDRIGGWYGNFPFICNFKLSYYE